MPKIFAVVPLIATLIFLVPLRPEPVLSEAEGLDEGPPPNQVYASREQSRRVKLAGEWIATIYAEDLVGRQHGAAWNGFRCRREDGRPLPDVVTMTDLALAAPGPEFYCLPLTVCYAGLCVTGIAVDVSKEDRLRGPDGRLYSHLDLYPALADQLGIEGLQWGEIEVYVGPKPQAEILRRNTRNLLQKR